jgi:hypothetical protein
MLTVATLEEALAEEIGPYYAVCKLNATPTVDGSNKDMRGVIRDAVEQAGGTIAEFPFVTDADVATVQIGPRKLIKLMVIRGLEKAWGNWPKWDQKDGDSEHKLRQLGDALLKRIEQLQAELAAKPGEEGGEPIIVHAPESGVIQAGSHVQHDPHKWTYGEPFPY